MISELSKTSQNILISLHPKQDLKKYIFLEKKFNCKILNERLMDVLPVADVFISSYSSTAIWSVICGVKTLIMDFYGFNSSIFDDFNSITFIKNKEDFKSGVNSLLKKKIDFSSDWESLSREKVFDNGVIDRYLEIISNMDNSREING